MAGFLFYEDYYRVGKELPTPEDKVQYYEAIFERGLYQKPLPKSRKAAVRTAFIFIESLIAANEKRKKNGKKGGRPPKKTENSENPKTSGKPVVSLNDNDNVNANANDKAFSINMLNDNTSSDMVPLKGDQSSEDAPIEFDEEGWEDA